MIKVIPPRSWADLYDGPQLEEIKVASCGLRGDDLKSFVKRASHYLADWVRNNLPKPGEVYVHNIAMGAGEAVGANRNSDYYSARMLRRDHPTFEKYANFFINHCFVGETPVVMADRTRRPISDVHSGDKVATADGDHSVMEVYANDYDGPIFTFKFTGIPEKMTVTPNHPLYVIRRSTLFTKSGYCRLNSGSNGRSSSDWGRPVVAEYAEAGTVLPGDYVLVPRPTPGGRQIDPNIAELVGWVAADGHIAHNGSIEFTLSRQRKIAAIRDVFVRLGCRVNEYPRRADKQVALSVQDAALARCLRQYVTGTYDTKTLTAEVLAWDVESIQRMLGAYIDGDGNFSKQNRGILRIRSSSPPMQRALTDCVRAVGGACTIQIDKKSGPFISPLNKKIYTARASGCVTVPAAYFDAVCKYATTRPAAPPLSINPMPLVWGAHQLVKVTAREEDRFVGKVYNLNVPGPQHYIAAEVQVHNCNTDPTKGYGPVKRAWYNEPMQRVELIVALNATKEAADRNKGLIAERTLQKLASNIDIAVSQSCRVKHDVCSSCGNKAKNRSQYCTAESGCKYGGCRDNLGRTFDDGFHLYVDNPHCTFFDISDVSDTRGADRTAFITGKVANNDLRVAGGAELADMLGLVAPEYLLDRDTIAATSCLRKLAAAQHPHAGAPSWSDILAIRGRNKTAHSHTIVFSGGAPERHAKLSELGAAGVILPPSQWLAAVTGAPVEKCARAFFNGVDPRRDLLDRDDLHEIICTSAPVVDNRLSTEKYAWMAPTVAAHARETQLSVLAPPAETTKISSAPEPVRKEAAAAYLAYQARVLAFHKNSANFDLLLSECVRHNRGTTA